MGGGRCRVRCMIECGGVGMRLEWVMRSIDVRWVGKKNSLWSFIWILVGLTDDVCNSARILVDTCAVVDIQHENKYISYQRLEGVVGSFSPLRMEQTCLSITISISKIFKCDIWVCINAVVSTRWNWKKISEYYKILVSPDHCTMIVYQTNPNMILHLFEVSLHLRWEYLWSTMHIALMQNCIDDVATSLHFVWWWRYLFCCWMMAQMTSISSECQHSSGGAPQHQTDANEASWNRPSVRRLIGELSIVMGGGWIHYSINGRRMPL